MPTMENPYSMAKLSLDAKENLRPKRDCGFYAKYFFLFLSLIQFLIILGLVLFMVYGNAQVGTEQHVQELKGNLQQCTLSLKTRGQEAASLKRQLNASQVLAGQLQGHLTRVNASHRTCNSEKVKVMEMWRRDSAMLKANEENRYTCSLLNFTCTAKMAILQEQMKALELSSTLEKDKLSLEVEMLKGKAEKGRQEKEVCEIAKRKVETQVQTYGQLEAKVLEEMSAARQKLQATVDQVPIPSAFSCSPYDINSVRQACMTLSSTLQGQLEAQARRIDQRINEVAQQNAKAESDKALCQRDLENSRQQLSLQREQSERDKQKLRESHETEAKKKDEEVGWLKAEKTNLQLQLDKSKQACLSMRINTIPPRFPGVPGTPVGSNPLGTFPGNIPSTGNHGMSGGIATNPHAFGNPSLPGRSGTLSQPNSGSQGNPSYHDRFKVPENKRNPVESVKIENHPPLSPVEQHSG